jgi:hypothetical protein
MIPASNTNKPFIYLDQNIVSKVATGEFKLEPSDDCIFAYSTEHFTEISRSANPEPFLQALYDLKATCLSLVLKDSKITGEARPLYDSDPFELYSNHLNSTPKNGITSNLFDPLIAWVNGGKYDEELRGLPAQLITQLRETLTEIPIDLNPALNMLEPAIGGMNPFIEEMISNGNDINKTRQQFSSGVGSIGSIIGENVIDQIWEKLNVPKNTITKDQFFGFKPHDLINEPERPLVLGINSCCSVFDIIGYKAEKKIRKLEKIGNIRSDAMHIAMAGFCSLLITSDQRLKDRAKAIYDYLAIPTNIAILTVNREKT